MKVARFRTITVIPAAAALVIGTASGCGSGSDSGAGSGQQETITVQTHGGSWQENFKKYVVEPFEKETGVQVNLAVGKNTAVLNSLRATKGKNPQYDLAVLSKLEIKKAIDEGLIQPIDTSRIAEWKNLAPELYQGEAGLTVGGTVYAVPTVVGRVGIAYREDKVPTPPKNWMSAFKNESLWGHIAVFPPSNTSAGVGFLLEVAKELGYDTTKPESVSNTIRDLAFLKGHVSAFPDSNATTDQLLTTGDAWVAPAFDGRALALQAKGAPVGFTYSETGGAVAYGNPFVIPTGVDKLDPIYKFIDYMTNPKYLGEFGSSMFYGVANIKSVYSGDAAGRVKTGAEAYDDLLWSDPEMIVEHTDEWQSVWNATFR